jgi:transmembrane sensor
MSKLQLPIAKELRDDAPSDADLRRLWSGVQDRIQRPRRRGWLVAPAFAAAILCAFWLGTRFQARHEGPLPIASSDLEKLSSPGADRTVAFAEGSTVALDAVGVIETTANEAHAVDVTLRAGSARFTIAQSPRRWTIDTGVGVIQVSAAKFAVWRSESGVDVQVFEGTIVVRGAGVSNGARKLGQNERLHLAAVARDYVPAPSVPPIPSAPIDGAPKVTAPAEPKPIPRQRRKVVPAPDVPSPTWQTLADEKKYDDAYAQLGKEGVTNEAKKVDTVDDLLRLSDVARLSGHPVDALPSLDRILGEFPTDRRAGIAAFTRGRIAADDLHDATAAADAFARAISLGLPGALRETAQYRLVEARDRAGDREGAAAAARDYRSQYPNGRYRSEPAIQSR